MTVDTAATQAPAPFSPSAPRRPRTGLRVLGVVLVLVVGVGIASKATATETTRHDVTGHVDTLVVASPAGDVDITVGGSTTSVTTTRAEPLWGTTTASEQLQDGVLELTADCDGGFGCVVAYEVTVPAGTAIEVRGRAGDVTVTGADAPVDIDVTAGDVTVTDALADVIRTRTTAGDIDISAATPPERVEARSTAGDVTIDVPRDRYRVSTDTTAGSIETAVIEDVASARSLLAETTAGDIVIRSR